MSLPKIRGDFKYQVEQEIPTINALAKSSDSARCAVGEYGFNETVQGLSIDSNGILKIANTDGIYKTYLAVKVQVGYQSFLTSGFSVEVLDCYKFITLPEIWKQLATSTDDRIQKLDAKPYTYNQAECPIDSFEVSTKDKYPAGLEINSDGVVSVDRKVIYKEIIVDVVVKCKFQTLKLPSIVIKLQSDQNTGVAYFGIGIIPADASPPVPVMYIIYPILLVLVIGVSGYIIFKLHK